MPDYSTIHVRWLQHLASSATTRQRYELAQALGRLDGDIEAWFAEPSEIRYKELNAAEEILFPDLGTGEAISAPATNVGLYQNEPDHAEAQFRADLRRAPQVAGLTSSDLAALVDHEARKLSCLLHSEDFSPATRFQWVIYFFRRVLKMLGDLLPGRDNRVEMLERDVDEVIIALFNDEDGHRENESQLAADSGDDDPVNSVSDS